MEAILNFSRSLFRSETTIEDIVRPMQTITKNLEAFVERQNREAAIHNDAAEELKAAADVEVASLKAKSKMASAAAVSASILADNYRKSGLLVESAK